MSVIDTNAEAFEGILELVGRDATTVIRNESMTCEGIQNRGGRRLPGAEG